jgi:hypothetical protein
VEWQGHGSCNNGDRRTAARQVERLFDTFQVLEGKDLRH